ncbi:MAG: biotin/lipoyl-binding protein [Euryarchaeota archaeon]|nr:biotin/lipoyl-binding protein [Euryarchaeota archaeon]
MKGGGAASGITQVKPPMPGKVVKVAVSAGDVVQAGDVLVVLEAMKMQNEIVSPVEGTVKSVGVENGENIDAKRVLVEIE